MTTKETQTQGLNERPLPPGWRWVRLGEVCDFQYGSSLTEKVRRPGSVPVYGSNGIVGYHDTPLTSGPTVVVGRKGSVGQVHYSGLPCFPIDTTYYIDSAKLPLDLRWLAYILPMLDLSELNKASGVPGLNRYDAYKQTLPLPPLAEQQRIAAVLRDQMAAVDKARAAAQARLEAVQALPAAFARRTVQNGQTRRHLLGECRVEVRNGAGADWAKYPVLGATRAGLAPAKEAVGKAPEWYKLVDPVTVFYNPMRILLLL